MAAAASASTISYAPKPGDPGYDVYALTNEIVVLWGEYRPMQRDRYKSRAEYSRIRYRFANKLAELRQRLSAREFRRRLIDRDIKIPTAYRLILSTRTSLPTNNHAPAGLLTEKNNEPTFGPIVLRFDPRQLWLIKESLAAHRALGSHFDLVQFISTTLTARAGLK